MSNETTAGILCLPDLVLCSVFETVCTENKVSLDTAASHAAGAWKGKLALVAVCQRWRRLGLPIVHRDSVIHCRYVKANASSRAASGGGSAEVATEPLLPPPSSNGDGGGQPGGMRVKTSLDIIPRTSQKEEEEPWVCFPKRLQIQLACPDIPAHALGTAVGTIRGHRALLTRVTRVELKFALDPYGHLIWRAVPVGVAQARELGREFAQLLAAVTDFVWHPPYGNEVPVVFANEAIRTAYASQLRRLVGPGGALAGVPEITGDLAHAVITFVPKRQPKHLPHTRAAGLVFLRLDEIDEGFPWDAFASSSKEEEEPLLLDFASLRRITLGCAVTDAENDEGDDVWEAPALPFSPRYRVTAPRLEYLRIQLCAHLLSLASSIQGTDTIGVFEIEARGASVRLTQFRLDLARHQLAGYARASAPQEEEEGGGGGGATEPVDWYGYLNDILATPGIAKDYKASVGLGNEFVDIDRIDWPCLTSLQICCPMSYADLKRMVDKMPALTELSVSTMMVRQEAGQDEAAGES